MPRLFFYGGLILLVGGFSLLPSVDRLAVNGQALAAPWAILAGYLMVGLSVLTTKDGSNSRQKGVGPDGILD